MSATTVVMLQKNRRTQKWQYLADHTQGILDIRTSYLLEEFSEAIDQLKLKFNAGENQLVFLTRSYGKSVDREIRELHPDILFVKLSDMAMISAFISAFQVNAYKKRTNGRTLYIGSDGSGGHNETISGWAWASQDSYNMGICQVRDINISEFEGMLRAIIDNKDTPYARICLYSDSIVASQNYEKAIVNGETLSFVEGAYLEPLVTEVREIVKDRIVKLVWVKGHRTHRLNTAADILSRHIRKWAFSGKGFRTIQMEADALFKMFER